MEHLLWEERERKKGSEPSVLASEAEVTEVRCLNALFGVTQLRAE